MLVLATDDLATADRVLLFVGETAQDLGILAHRVVGGGGGIDHGSIVAMVQQVRGTDTQKTDPPPAILIANPGEIFWWPEARRALSLPACEGMPRPSAAHLPPRRMPGQNVVPGHETADAHIASVFEDLLGPAKAPAKAPVEAPAQAHTRDDEKTAAAASCRRITAIAIAGGADALEAFLDHPDRWRRWGPHMDSLAVLGGLYEEHHIKTDAFRSFLRQRGRAYIASEAPVDTPVAGPDGNDQAVRATRFGCPVHSAGTTWLTELMFVEVQAAILAWGQAVARDRDYVNPQIGITYAEKILTVEDTTWANYKEPEEEGDGGEKTGARGWDDLVMADIADEQQAKKEASDPAHETAAAVAKSGGTNSANESAVVDGIKDKLAGISLQEK